jgi:CRISPR-associated protein Cas1
MHSDGKNAPAFVFDLTKTERQWADRAVLDFVTGHALDPADFIIRTDGICRLNPEMARLVVARVSAPQA